MEENKQVEESTSLLDILKLLLSKIKILILVVIIGAIVGGGAAIISTININYWGTTVEFYVNPEKTDNVSTSPENAASGSQYGVYGAYGRHVMDNIVKLLNSEIFAEQLILNGEILPEKDVWVNAASESETALNLNDKIDAASAAIATADEKQAAADTQHSIVAAISTDYANKMSALSLAWSKSPLSKQSLSFNEEEYLAYLRGQGDSELDAAYDAWNAAKTILTSAQQTANEAQKVANSAQAEANGQIQIALDAWRQTQKYKNTHAAYKKAVSYSYLKDEDDFENANNLARSFIYVSISVLDDQEFATTILERVKTQVPIYIEANMAIPDGYSGTNCQRITTKDYIDLTNPGYTKNEAIKYALLVALVAAVITCVVIIIVDKSDKRLRDTDSITKLFNVPVLGIVPTIDELVEESNAKKNAANSEVK